MKVSQILYSGLGGHGSVVFSLINGDSNKEWENKLIFYGIEPMLNEYENKCNSFDIPYVSIKKKLGLDLFSWRRLYLALKEQNPDAVLLHNGTVLFPTLTYCIFYSKKLVLIEHTPIISKTAREWFFTHISALFLKKIVVLTKNYKSQLLKKTIGLTSTKFNVISNGIDVNFFNCPKKGVNSNGYLLGMVSRLSRPKDHLTLIKSIKDLVGMYPKIKLLIAGDGEMKEEIELRIKALGLSDQIQLVGLLNEEQILSFMKSLDIYVHSSYSETMSTSIMQAMSCGMPIVASRTEGVSNLVIDEETGILFEPKNDKDLADKISYYFENLSVMKQLGKNARKYAVKYLSNTTMFNAYSKLLK